MVILVLRILRIRLFS